MNAARVDAVLLAAGAGRRLGIPKAALQLRGRWMLPRIVSALRGGGADHVHLVLSEAAVEAIAGLGDPGADTEVINPQPELGRTGSLLCGLAAIDSDPDAVLVHPCDVPLLAADAVSALIHAWASAADRQHLVARLVTPAGHGGHPLLVGRSRLEELRGFGPDQPLRDLLHADRALRLDVKRKADPGPFLDVDTPEQAALLEDMLNAAPDPGL